MTMPHSERNSLRDKRRWYNAPLRAPSVPLDSNQADVMPPLLRLRLFAAVGVFAMLAASISSSKFHAPLQTAEATPTFVRSTPDELVDDPLLDNRMSVAPATRVYFFAGSRIKDGPGAGRSYNFPQRATRTECEGLFLLAQPGVATTWKQLTWDGRSELEQERPGMRIVLVNRTDKLVSFRAVDSQLYMALQARDPDGKWKQLHGVPGSTGCPASLHRVFLEPNHFWQFGAPRYRGEFATKLRVALMVDYGGPMLYSNEFDGSIDLKQIRRKRHPALVGEPDLWNEW